MSKEYEVFKCQTLIKMLTRRKQKLERALEIYPKSVYEEALERIEKSKQRRIENYEKSSKRN
jgi:hypothetical protein